MELKTAWQQLGIKISTDAQQKLEQFVTMLLKWNQAYNLTNITAPEKIITHHILDSLAALPYLKGERVIDVGTGAGFPGIPLALAQPDWHFVLLDSVGKKIRFLTQVVAELELKNVEPVHSRAEDYHPPTCFNSVIARALTSVNDMISKTSHLCCPDGQILMLKGVIPTAELAEVKLPHQVHRLDVPGLHEERHIVTISLSPLERRRLG